MVQTLCFYINDDVWRCFYINECGLFFQVLSNKSVTFKNEKCNDGKVNEESSTVLFTVNTNGSEKLTPIVIGKFLKPHSLIRCKYFPVSYNASQKALMTTSIWKIEIWRFNKIRTGKKSGYNCRQLYCLLHDTQFNFN